MSLRDQLLTADTPAEIADVLDEYVWENLVSTQTDAAGATVLVGAGCQPFRPKAAIGSSVATRIPSGEVDALSNQLGATYCVGMRLADAFDSVRIIYLNQCATPTTGMLCAVSVASDLSSMNNSAGTWVAGTIADAAARVSALEPSITFSDWIDISSDDGILYARLYTPSAGNTESSVCSQYEGGASNDPLDWAGMVGDEWINVKNTGDGVTVPANFTNTTLVKQNSIAGVQYRARGVVYTVMGVGDSIMYGTKTVASGDPFWASAVRQLKVAGVKVEACNFGRPGQKTGEYYPRIANAISSIKPDAVIYGAYSPNDAAVPSESTMKAQRLLLSKARDACKATGIQLIAMTGIPKGSGAYNVSAYTDAQDDYRKQVNITARALPLVLDLDSVISNSTVLGVASYFADAAYPSTDFIHLSADGNLAAVTESKRAISQALLVSA